jgi:acetyl-CoA carboxylase biotin carboxyl carrier protein
MDAPDRFRELSAWLAATDIASLELRGPGTWLRLRRDGANRVEVVEVDAGSASDTGTAARRHADSRGGVGRETTVVRSPCVGVLRHRHPLHDAALAVEGQPVVADQALALLQIGPTLVPAPAPRDGVVARVVARDGAAVGYGDPLVELL